MSIVDENISIASRIEKYVNQQHSSKEFVHGINDKLFLRIDDDIRDSSKYSDERKLVDPKDIVLSEKTIQDSAIFTELFASLMSHDNHYITSFNDLLSDKKQKPYIPKFVPVLAKIPLHKADTLCAEVVGSRLSSAVGCDTVFNIAPRYTRQKNEFLDIDKNTLFSVDFLPYGWDYSIFNDLTGKFGVMQCPLKMFLKQMDDRMPEQFYEMYNIKLKPAQIEKIKREFVKQYLFRVCLCNDRDFGTHNSGVMFSEKAKEIRLLPNFDMEYMFYEPVGKFEERRIKEAFKFCNQEYKDILDEFVVAVKGLNKGKLQRIIHGGMEIAEDNANVIMSIVSSHIDAISDIYASIQTADHAFDR